jgi:hypothetical protein
VAVIVTVEFPGTDDGEITSEYGLFGLAPAEPAKANEITTAEIATNAMAARTRTECTWVSPSGP